MTPTPEQIEAVAWAWHGLRNGRRETPCKTCHAEAAAILAALPDWTLVPRADLLDVAALREAVRDFLEYDETGAPGFLEWDEKIEAVRAAFATPAPAPGDER